MHATIRRYDDVDTSRINEIVGKVDETFVPQIRELPGFRRLLPHRDRQAAS